MKSQGQRWGFSIPHGIRRSAIPVHLVCGPPGAGKSTYVKQRVAPNDIVIDWDDIRRECGAERGCKDELKLKRAFHKRAQLIDSLAYARRGAGWLIVCAPTKVERRQWCAALGNVTVHSMDVPQDVCRIRIMNDETRMDVLWHSLQTLDAYFAAQR